MLVISGRNGRDTKGNCHAVAGSKVTDDYSNDYVALTKKNQYMYIYFTIVKYTYIEEKMTEKRILHNE